MKRILTILFLMAGLTAFGQTYKTTTSVLNDSTTLFRSGTYTANLDNRYAKIEDGLISGGAATTNGDSLMVASGVARINSTNISFTGRTFADIAPSGVGLTRILIIYANTSGTLDSIAGAQSNNPVEPTIPSNTIRVVTVSVSDAGLGVPTVDLSGYAKLVGGNSFSGNQILNDTLFFIKNTDEWKQYILGNTDTPSGDLVFQSGDNGDEGFVFKTFAPASITGYTDSTFFKIKHPQIELHLNSKFYGKAEYNTDLSGTYTNRSFIDKGYADLTYNPLLGYTPYNPVSYPVNLGGETLQSTSNRGNEIIRNISSVEPDYLILKNTQINPGKLAFGVHGSSSYGYIQSSRESLTYNNPLAIQPNGGNLGVGITNPTSLLHVNGLARATGFGAGIAPSANHYLTTAANTSTIGSWLWTPSSTDYTGTVSGTFYNNANELKFYDGTISGTNRLVKLRNNQSLAGSGTVGVISNNSGDISTVPIADRLISGEVQTSANRTLTLTDFGTNGTLTVYCTTSGGDVTITLPSVSDMRYLEVTIIKVTSGNNVIISGSANINGSASISESAQYKSYTLVSNGTQYYIKGERP